mmetsp:Transcript_58900/g.126795  ORF Transcript_58900/g.126795 Transcript_58900/m.126795 type:complete len:487 (+) Transcript_58900:503-1963(+)
MLHEQEIVVIHLFVRVPPLPCRPPLLLAVGLDPLPQRPKFVNLLPGKNRHRGLELLVDFGLFQHDFRCEEKIASHGVPLICLHLPHHGHEFLVVFQVLLQENRVPLQFFLVLGNFLFHLRWDDGLVELGHSRYVLLVHAVHDLSPFHGLKPGGTPPDVIHHQFGGGREEILHLPALWRELPCLPQVAQTGYIGKIHGQRHDSDVPEQLVSLLGQEGLPHKWNGIHMLHGVVLEGNFVGGHLAFVADLQGLGGQDILPHVHEIFELGPLDVVLGSLTLTEGVQGNSINLCQKRSRHNRGIRSGKCGGRLDGGKVDPLRTPRHLVQRLLAADVDYPLGPVVHGRELHHVPRQIPGVVLLVDRNNVLNSPGRDSVAHALGPLVDRLRVVDTIRLGAILVQQRSARVARVDGRRMLQGQVAPNVVRTGDVTNAHFDGVLAERKTNPKYFGRQRNRPLVQRNFRQFDAILLQNLLDILWKLEAKQGDIKLV